jgi:hypothetical protein
MSLDFPVALAPVSPRSPPLYTARAATNFECIVTQDYCLLGSRTSLKNSVTSALRTDRSSLTDRVHWTSNGGAYLGPV